MKSLLILLALTMSVSAFARDSYRGSYSSDRGDTIIRISVGNEKDTDSRAMMKRMVQLERAVRELQNRVYDLEDDAKPVMREVRYHTCSIKSNFGESYIGKTSLTEIEARDSALKACGSKRNPMFCEERNLRCESRVEYQKL